MKENTTGRAAATLEAALVVGAAAGFSSTIAESTFLCAHGWSPRAEPAHVGQAILSAGGVYFAICLLVSLGAAGILWLDNLRLRFSSAFAGLDEKAARRKMLEDRLTALALVACIAVAMSGLVNNAATIPTAPKRLLVVGVTVMLTMTVAIPLQRLLRRLASYAIAFFEDRRAILAMLCLSVMATSMFMALRLPHSQIAYAEAIVSFGVGGAVLALLKRGAWPRWIIGSALGVCSVWLALFFVRGTSANAYLMHRMGRTLVSIVLREIPFHRMTPSEERVNKAILTRFKALRGADVERGLAPARVQEPTPMAADRPDIVLVTIDTLREDRLLGSTSKMPNLAAIAAEGALFRHTFAAAPATIGAMTQVMTGQAEHEAPHLVAWTNTAALLDPTTPTIASRLLSQGYNTVAIVGGRLVSYYPSLGLGFSRIIEIKEGERALPAHELVDNFEKVVASPERRAPLFVWLHFLEPHYHTEGGAPIPQGYDTIVRDIDAEIGRIYAALKASPRFAKTALLVLADHGEGLGERGLVYHGVSLPVVMKIPFVARFPDEQPTVVDDLVSQLDVAPTILAAAGIEAPDLPGRALQRRLADKSPPRQYAFFENVYHLQPLQPYELGVTAPPWFYSFDVRERRSVLVNLADDPEGLRNLADERPEEAQRLGNILADKLENER